MKYILQKYIKSKKSWKVIGEFKNQSEAIKIASEKCRGMDIALEGNPNTLYVSTAGLSYQEYKIIEK